MNDKDDEVAVTITVSRSAYEKAARLAKTRTGLAGLMSAEEYIERLDEIALEE